MRKYLLLLVLLFIGVVHIYADDIKFVISAPDATVNGAQVQLKYILRGGQATDIRIPDEIKGFDILYGPSVMQSISSSNINGKVTSESNVTYTWVLMATTEGTFNLPAATAKVNGKNYTSNTKQIKVLPPDKNAEPAKPGRQPQTITSFSTAQNISADDAFVRAIFSKTKVNEQEAVVVIFRFYTVLNVRSVGKIEFPEFEGFISEEFDLPPNRQLQLEHYKGRNYMALDVKKTLLFPQRAGKVTIPSGTMEFVFEVGSGHKVRTFFGMEEEIMTEAKKTLKTTPVVVDISSLPTEGKPAGFSGAVGTFSFNTSISGEKVTANDAVTINVDIKGTGNMKLIRNPEINLPKDFETYDPKVTNDFKITEKGLSGTKSIEYLFIPRYPGKYTIPSFEFSYFDTDSRSYKTISSPEYTLEVTPDPNASNASSTSYMNQREVQVERDIRYLKTGELKFRKPDNFFIGKTSYILWYIIPFILFVAAMVIYRKQLKANANVSLMRTRKANKVASRHLKLAKQYLKLHKKDAFYEKVLRAVWGYLSDKLTIPLADLNRENIETELSGYGVDESLIRQFISILDTCEFARYAPSASDRAMDDLYDETVDAIGKMESVIKKIL